MSILCFADVLQKVGLDPAKVKLIRHSIGHEGFKACYDANKVFEYTCHQKADFRKNYDYWVVFISGKGTLAKLFACYKVGDYIPDTPDNTPAGVPEIEAKKYQGKKAYFNLDHVDSLAEYENRLIIDWGKSAISWHQRGTIEKQLLQFRQTQRRFSPVLKT